MIWAATQGPEVGTPFPQIFISTFPQYGILVYMSLSVLLKLKYDIDLKEKVGGSDWVGCVIFTAGFLAWAFVVHKHLQTKVFAQVNPRRAIGSYRSPRAPLTLRAPLRRSSSPARSERSRRSTARARRRGSPLCVDDSHIVKLSACTLAIRAVACPRRCPRPRGREGVRRRHPCRVTGAASCSRSHSEPSRGPRIRHGIIHHTLAAAPLAVTLPACGARSIPSNTAIANWGGRAKKNVILSI